MTTNNLFTTKSSWLHMLSGLPPHKRKIIDYLYFCSRKVKAGQWHGIFPSMERIAYAAGCCVRTVQRFLKDIQGWWLTRRGRMKLRDGIPIGQSSNEYFLHKSLLQCLDWMYKKGMPTSKAKFRKLIACAEIEERTITHIYIDKLSPPYAEKCHPIKELIKDSYSGVRRGFSMVLSDIRMSVSDKMRLTEAFEDRFLAVARSTMHWYNRERGYIRDLVGFFFKTAAKEKRRAAEIERTLANAV